MTTLLQEIARCPWIQLCIQNPSTEHACRGIVLSQQSSSLDEHQVAEPWSGRIEQAPILFLGSNPSMSSAEDFPNWSWSNEAIDDYFNNRFGSGQKAWIVDGTKSLQKDGTYSRSVRFWIAIRKHASDLLQRTVVPGVDYAITEVAHCKSRSEIGVKQAQQQCASSYLQQVLETAAAKVIVVLGVHARIGVQSTFNISENTSLSKPMLIGDRTRLVVFLPHPNARCPRSLTKCLTLEQLESLRALLL